MQIFNNYKDLIKEGNTLLFNVDISRDKENLRVIIRKIEDLDKIYNNQNFKINLYLSQPNDFMLLDNIISPTTNKNELFVFYEKDGKLISFDFSNKYAISNFSILDKLDQSKKINYSFEI